jgi:hypothetical protein
VRMTWRLLLIVVLIVIVLALLVAIIGSMRSSEGTTPAVTLDR